MASFTEHNENCVPLLLTLRLGPKSGTTSVSCTCGWTHTYKSRHRAEKRTRGHLELTKPREQER